MEAHEDGFTNRLQIAWKDLADAQADKRKASAELREANAPLKAAVLASQKKLSKAMAAVEGLRKELMGEKEAKKVERELRRVDGPRAGPGLFSKTG